MSAPHDREDVVSAKHYAALAVAVGRLRGILHDVVDGDFSKEDAQRILDGTSTAEIARALGKNEEDLAIDWNQYLSDEEKQRIG